MSNHGNIRKSTDVMNGITINNNDVIVNEQRSNLASLNVATITTDSSGFASIPMQGLPVENATFSPSLISGLENDYEDDDAFDDETDLLDSISTIYEPRNNQRNPLEIQLSGQQIQQMQQQQLFIQNQQRQRNQLLLTYPRQQQQFNQQNIIRSQPNPNIGLGYSNPNYINIDNIVTQPSSSVGGLTSDAIAKVDNFGKNFLSFLSQTNELKIKQVTEFWSFFLKCQGQVEFNLFDENDTFILNAKEKSSIFCRFIFSSARSLLLIVRDRYGHPMMQLERGLDCSLCFGLFCADKVLVKLPNGELIGYIKEDCSLRPSYTISNLLKQPVMSIKGSLFDCTFCPGHNIEFKIRNRIHGDVGRIVKEWSGCGRELFTIFDDFRISLQNDLDPYDKALCIGALFLINFRQYDLTTWSKLRLAIVFFLLYVFTSSFITYSTTKKSYIQN